MMGLSIGCRGSGDAGGGAPAGGSGGGGGIGVGGAAGAGASSPGLPVLGNGTHSMAGVQLTVVGTAADGLDVPRDLAFHNVEAEQLWVVNRATPSVTVFFAVGKPDQFASTRSGPGSSHFLAEPAALAFGAPGFFATAQEQDEVTQPSTPATFMGPTLWTSDTSFFEGGLASHYDMLHNSPSSAGIAWESDNVYWVFDGYHASLTRYDFGLDHGPGGSDHSGGIIARYAEGQVSYVPDVPSHLEYDAATGLLYVADTGNARIAVLDTRSGVKGAPFGPYYDGAEQYRMEEAQVATLPGTDTAGLERPSGLALSAGLVYVTDNQSGKISAFDKQGKMIDWLATGLGPGSLMGIAVDPGGRLYIVDALGARVLRIEPLASP